MTTESLTIDDITGALLRLEPDAVRRWRLLGELADREIPRLRALCAAQLVADGHTVAETADQLGVTRQWVDAQLRQHDVPRPRAVTDRAGQRSGYRAGALLAYYEATATAVGRQDRWDKLLEQALGGRIPAMLPAEARGWLRKAPAHRETIEELEPVLTELPATGMTMQQRADLLLGYHHTRAAWVLP